LSEGKEAKDPGGGLGERLPSVQGGKPLRGGVLLRGSEIFVPLIFFQLASHSWNRGGSHLTERSSWTPGALGTHWEGKVFWLPGISMGIGGGGGVQIDEDPTGWGKMEEPGLGSEKKGETASQQQR